MNLILDKMAEHSASEFAKIIYPDTTSRGKYDIRGQSLDFGTETYLPSHQKVHVLLFVDKGLLTKVQADELSFRYPSA